MDRFEACVRAAESMLAGHHSELSKAFLEWDGGTLVLDACQAAHLGLFLGGTGLLFDVARGDQQSL